MNSPRSRATEDGDHGRTTTPAGLSDAQRTARAEVIDHLGHYWREGVFPINDYLPGITPVFIDRVGTHCARATTSSGSNGLTIQPVAPADLPCAFLS